MREREGETETERERGIERERKGLRERERDAERETCLCQMGGPFVEAVSIALAYTHHPTDAAGSLLSRAVA